MILGSAADVWGGLDVTQVGRMRDDERGGVAVVLLHGWGADGDDLVPVARALSRPGTRFVVPEAPLQGHSGGRAWWHLHEDDSPAYARDDQPQAVREPPRDLKAARSSVQKILMAIRERYQPDTLAIVGFSQGAMLALDVALAATPRVDRVAVMSGVLLADSLSGLRAEGATRPAVFISHGRGDAVVPFQGGERAREILSRHGFPVTWCPFDGGHEIPGEVVQGLGEFLFEKI